MDTSESDELSSSPFFFFFVSFLSFFPFLFSLLLSFFILELLLCFFSLVLGQSFGLTLQHPFLPQACEPVRHDALTCMGHLEFNLECDCACLGLQNVLGAKLKYITCGQVMFSPPPKSSVDTLSHPHSQATQNCQILMVNTLNHLLHHHDFWT